MRYPEGLHIVRGSQKYIGAQDKDIMLPYTLEATNRALIEGERNLVLNLADQYGREREESYTYRLYGKINVLTDNSISGCSYDSQFVSNHLYYDPIVIAESAVACGYPSNEFFNFITSTGLTSAHNFQELKAKKDNWIIYESYVKDTKIDQPMEYSIGEKDNNGVYSYNGVSFTSGDGIPFYIENVVVQGKAAIKFVCPMEHGLNEGEYIQLQSNPNINTIGAVGLVTTINNEVTSPIFSLGDETLDSESKVFTVLLRDTDLTLVDNDFGVFKRLINPDNINETLSSYYVHVHTILTKPTDHVLDKTSFELGIYSKREKTFIGEDAPMLGVTHKVIKDEYKSYLWNFTNDLDVSDYSDNLGRPLLNLYLSVFAVNETKIWKTTFGSCVGVGWDWNFIPTGIPDPYPNNKREDNLTTPWNLPQSGDTFLGAFVEYNEWDLTERIISEVHHKLTYNDVMTDGFSFYDPGLYGDSFDEIKGGFYYQPHHRIPIRKLSEAPSVNENFEFVPQYATYSMFENQFRWRPMLPIGFYETKTHGVDYAFVNGAHYPYTNLIFKIKPIIIDKDYLTPPYISLPADDCE
jgi:hypothetical protein|tara:strand:- start:4521 stop:6257 length:1737 start_codon:yes stop_codon:yes gene_type:complete